MQNTLTVLEPFEIAQKAVSTLDHESTPQAIVDRVLEVYKKSQEILEIPNYGKLPLTLSHTIDAIELQAPRGVWETPEGLQIKQETGDKLNNFLLSIDVDENGFARRKNS